MYLPKNMKSLHTSILKRTHRSYLRVKNAMSDCRAPESMAIFQNINEAIRKLEQELKRRSVDVQV